MRTLLASLAFCAPGCLTMVACKKEGEATEATKVERSPLYNLYKDKLAGPHVWHRLNYINSYAQHDSTTFLADTTFSIALTNDSTVLCMGYTLRYTDSIVYNENAGIIADTANYVYYASGTKPPVGTHSYRLLYINRFDDSARLKLEVGGLGGLSYQLFTTKIQ